MVSTVAANTLIAYEITENKEIATGVSSLINLLGRSLTETPSMYFGERKERYAGIDLTYFRVAMTQHEYHTYIDLIGEEKLGLLPEDFEEVYYPDEEE